MCRTTAELLADRYHAIAREISRTRAVPSAHCSCSHRISLIVFSARPTCQVGWRRLGSSSLSPSLPLDFHRGNVIARTGASWLRVAFCSTSFQLARSLGFARGRVPGGDGRGREGEGGGIKTSIVAVSVASLPGNLLVMLISSYKPFIIVDEQLIRLPGPLAWQC